MVMELLYRTARARPGDEALVCGDERLTYAQLVERIERLAHGLSTRGIGAGDAVTLLLPNGIDFVVSFYAVAGLGAIVSPLNPQFKQDELTFCIKEADSRAIITDDPTAGVCQRIVGTWDPRVEVLPISAAHGQALTLGALIAEHEPRPLQPRAADDALVYMFSSGSTGRPKLVMRTHGHLAAEAAMYPPIGVGADDIVFCTIPLFHTYAMSCCLALSLGTGAKLVILEDPNPFLLKRHRALDVIERERPTVYPGVPFNFRLLAEAPRDADLSSLRLCTSAGTALPREFFDAFRDRFGIPVRQLYGCTEGGSLTVNLDADPDATSASVGHPLEGIEVRIVDDERVPLPVGEQGEVAVSSPALTAGYAHNPDLSAEAFHDGFFYTGDLGDLDDEGRLTITGRKKLLIEVGGYKVDPIEVQDVVESHPCVAEAIVVGVPGAVPGEERVKAVIVASDACDERSIIAYCQERLANYKAPQLVEFRDEIPRNPMGKILRKYLV